MKLYNTLTRSVDELKPLQNNTVRMYSCGPTVYDHAHIGNLSAYIFADTLRRVLTASGYEVRQIMNYTDVDDKTIRKSREKYADDDPRHALHKLTDHYIEVFLRDMRRIGNDVDALKFLRATDTIADMQALITELYKKGYAYVVDDGVYFSIGNYQASGYDYGQLIGQKRLVAVPQQRIDNDEYSKDEATDFALWKKQKDNEPAWNFHIGGKDIPGRPGWHIECSAMSQKALGLPFDIHTGGVDLIFPHHENEIAQSIAGKQNHTMAQFFCHNEHILVDGKKMSKSLDNFYTLEDVVKKNYDPLAFRLLMLQAHYRNQVNFSWDNLQAAQNRLRDYQAMAALQWQASDDVDEGGDYVQVSSDILEALQDDLNTPEALARLSAFSDEVKETGVSTADLPAFQTLLQFLDNVFGLNLSTLPDISDEQKDLIANREAARGRRDWEVADQLRDQLQEQGISVRDTDYGPIWYKN